MVAVAVAVGVAFAVGVGVVVAVAVGVAVVVVLAVVVVVAVAGAVVVRVAVGLMGLLVPISAARVALAWNEWCDVHASIDAPLKVAKAQADRLTAVRTVCGSDVHPYIVDVGVAGDAVQPMMMSWPPPPALRCVDCQSITNTSRTRRNGWGSWDRLEPVNTKEGA